MLLSTAKAETELRNLRSPSPSIFGGFANAIATEHPMVNTPLLGWEAAKFLSKLDVPIIRWWIHVTKIHGPLVLFVYHDDNPWVESPATSEQLGQWDVSLDLFPRRAIPWKTLFEKKVRIWQEL